MENKDKPAYPARIHEVLTEYKPLSLTKREAFAIAAMQGIISATGHRGDVHYKEEIVVENAIRIADELLKQLGE